MVLKERAIGRVRGAGNSKGRMKNSSAGRGRIDREVGVHGRCWLKVRVFGREKVKAKHQEDAFSENKKDIGLERAVVRLGKPRKTESYRGWFVRLTNKRWEGNTPRHELVQQAFASVRGAWAVTGLSGACPLRVGRIEAGEAAVVARGTLKVEEQRWDGGRVDRSISSRVPTT